MNFCHGRIFNFIFAAVLAAAIQLVSLTAQAVELPSLSSPVIDQLGFLRSSEKRELADQIYNFKKNHSAQIQVLIVDQLQGLDIETFAIQTFDRWKLGSKEKDDGVLLLIAPTERKLRIEVGRGLEGSIPDIIAKQIIREITTPLFKDKEFYVGTYLTVVAIEEAILAGDKGQVFRVDDFKQKILSGNLKSISPDLDGQNVSLPEGGEGARGKLPLIYVLGFLFLLWLVIFFINPTTALYILYALLSGGRGGGGSSSGGGSWGGGGGSSSGGGASGGW